MPDTRLRSLERDAAVGGHREQLELDRAVCRAQGCDYVFLKLIYENEMHAPETDFSVLRLLVCRRCLQPSIEWRPRANITRCLNCRSPVRVRASGYCVTCTIDVATKRRTPTGRRRFSLAWTKKGGRTHIVGKHILEVGFRVVSLCGIDADQFLPDVGMPTCQTCDATRKAEHRREKENTRWEGDGS